MQSYLPISQLSLVKCCLCGLDLPRALAIRPGSKWGFAHQGCFDAVDLRAEALEWEDAHLDWLWNGAGE